MHMNTAAKIRKKERLAEIEAVIAKGPYRDSWDSLESVGIPDWYQDAKFGILFTGGCTVCRRSETNGIPGTCTGRKALNMNIM